jgi:glycosyltransferase involved in cell wall biosynthesis
MYLKDRDRNIMIHIVGEGLELEHYKSLTAEYGIKEHVIFQGLKYGTDLDSIYDQCSLGVECLGMHRKGLHLSSSLKSREYAAKGLPIISSAAIDYLPKDYKYLLKVPSDESPIDVADIINFYDSTYENTDPRMVASSIHMFG